MSQAAVELDSVTIKFGDFVAVRDVNIDIGDGEFFSFLGPSGCGKTTLLRAVSGFLEPTDGHVRIHGNDMAGIGPNVRPTALIFQNLALFPLMTVWENIAFGLEVRGVGKRERRDRAEELLDLIALPGQGDKMVSELSGGQRQRVAIARALAVEPKVLLLDEPLSALDLKLRQHMRTELRAIQQRVGITFIYITHDQGEALTMSDRIAVMSAGVVEQVGKGADIYDRPDSAFVASFVGENNAFRGRVTQISGDEVKLEGRQGQLVGRFNPDNPVREGDEAYLFVRPESFKFADAANADAVNTIKATVREDEFEGSFHHLILAAGEDDYVRMSLTNDGSHSSNLKGAEQSVRFEPARGVVLPIGPLATE
ncbi:ABC transporter ATP-binding protein [Marivibrio halodurans]|uniref:ABC transporter ATP-binding protein n=1 Tax=Marivibrio halodurans TaxID=2039722 RepID=A0A8J7RZ45_9PROT|nr:ABC transporter ATP-binding protein [Marivibrio halodurans]MBP5856990.1 ABC transporter ATP-binding protein [Marivibrio halodurans]